MQDYEGRQLCSMYSLNFSFLMRIGIGLGNCHSIVK